MFSYRPYRTCFALPPGHGRARLTDSIFHPQIFTDKQISEMPDYAEQYGIRSFKFYMCGLSGIVNAVSDDVLLKGFRQIAELGGDVIACVHCENGALIARSGGPQAQQAFGHAG